MKTIFVLLTFISLNSFSQEIKYNLVLKDPCSKKIENGILYHLKKSGKIFNISDSIGTIHLKEPGKYKLLALRIASEQIIEIKSGVNIDTLYIQKIEECLEPVSHPNFIGYCCCETKCQGVQKDYYNNGKLRIEGEFKDGLPIGKVRIYYPNGNLKEVRIYNKKGVLKRKIKYDSEENKK